MKKKLFALIAMVTLAFSAVGTAKAGGVYEGVAPGSSVLGVKLGFWNLGGNVTYDYSLARVWKGSFTIGGQAGYLWEGGSHSSIDIKIRTTYRFNVVVPEWEIYGGVGLGGHIGFDKGGVDGGFSGAFILGTTYNLTQNIGLNLEFDLGSWGQSWINLGVQFSF